MFFCFNSSNYFLSNTNIEFLPCSEFLLMPSFDCTISVVVKAGFYLDLKIRKFIFDMSLNNSLTVTLSVLVESGYCNFSIASSYFFIFSNKYFSLLIKYDLIIKDFSFKIFTKSGYCFLTILKESLSI